MTQDQLPMVAMPSMNDTHLEEMLLINRLETAASNSNVQAVRQSLKELQEHTQMHFDDEEDMMEEALFPAYERHKGEHDRHLHELQSIIEYFDKHEDTKAINAYITGNLIPWLINHIQTMDTITAQFLKSGF